MSNAKHVEVCSVPVTVLPIFFKVKEIKEERRRKKELDIRFN